MTAVNRRPLFSDHAALALKVYAIAFMVLDHIDTGLYGGALGLHATVGRTVFPVFAILLAFNLARARDPMHLIQSVAPRMALVGAVAHPFAMALWGADVALNVMFTLSASVLVVGMIRVGWRLAPACVFVVAGLFVDYGWFGIAALVMCWFAFSRGTFSIWLHGVCVAAILLPINGNWWALLAVPLLAAASEWVQGRAPRAKWLFYAFYPAHLAVLAVIHAT